MTKREWIEGYAAHLVAQGRGERTALLLATSTADMHERLRGTDVSLWPAMDVETRFETRDDSDVGEPQPE